MKCYFSASSFYTKEDPARNLSNSNPSLVDLKTKAIHKVLLSCCSCNQCCYFSYADRDQLQAIYSAYLQPVLSSSLKSHPVWGAVKNVHTLAGSMVSVYEQVSVQSTWYT